MNIRPHIQFYKTIFPFVMVSTFLWVISYGLFYGFIFFFTFGLGFGLLAFHSLYKSQWYTYQNLGITKWQLFKSSFVINLIVGFPIFTILFFLISFVIGDYSLT